MGDLDWKLFVGWAFCGFISGGIGLIVLAIRGLRDDLKEWTKITTSNSERTAKLETRADMTDIRLNKIEEKL